MVPGKAIKPARDKNLIFKFQANLCRPELLIPIL